MTVMRSFSQNGRSSDSISRERGLYFTWFEAISLLLCVAGFCFLIGGWPLFRWAWPSVAFLAFMVPLPFRVESAFCERLQAMAAAASTFSLQTMGFPAIREGNDILIHDERVGVEKACSGLSMMMTFFCLSTAVALLVKRPVWQKLVIVVSAIPIALLSNITRVTATVILFQLSADKGIRVKAHDWAGYMMMILGLLLLWAELKYLSWLVPEDGRQPNKPVHKPSLNRPSLPLPVKTARSTKRRRATGPV